MSIQTETVTIRSTTFTIGWIILIVISVLATLNHIMLPAYRDDVGLAIGWTGYSLYATVVFAIPFRRGERWAWYISWILVIGFAYPILIIRESYTVAYLIAAGVMAISLLITRPAFFRKET
jgi:hypothetical protein